MSVSGWVRPPVLLAGRLSPATTNVNAVAFGFVDSGAAPVGTCRMVGKVVAVAASRRAVSMLRRGGGKGETHPKKKGKGEREEGRKKKKKKPNKAAGERKTHPPQPPTPT